MGSGVSEKSVGRSLYEAVLYGMSRPVLALKGMAIIPLLTKTLGLADYGVWVLLTTTGALLIELIILRFPSAVLRLLPGSGREQLGRVYGTLLAVTAVMTVAVSVPLAIGAEPMGRWLLQRSGAGTYLYLLVALVATEAWWLLLCTYFRVIDQNVRHIGAELGFQVVDLAAMAMAIVAGAGLIGVLMAGVIVRGVATLLLAAVVQREHGFRMPSAPIATEYLSYCLPLVAPELISWVLSFGNRYFLAMYCGNEMVGIFGMAHKLAFAVLMISGALEFAFLTEVAGLWNAGETVRATARWRRVARLFIGVAVPLAGLLSLLSPYLLTVLSTPEAGLTAWRIVPWIAGAGIAYGLYGYAISCYLFARRTTVLLQVMGVASVVNLVLNALLVPRAGVIGAAVAMLVSYVGLMGLAVWRARRDFGFPIEGGMLLKALAAVGVMAVPFWIIAPQGAVEYGAAALLGAVGYGVTFWWLRGMMPEETALLKELWTQGVRRIGVSCAGVTR